MSSRASGRRVEARGYAAPDTLSDVVAAFWTGRWDLRGQAPHVTERLSDPCVHVVFEEGEGQPGSRLVGVWTRLWRRKLEGRGRVRAVKLRAGAVRAFVEAPASSFANRIVPLVSLFGPRVAALERAVLAPASDAEAFAALEAWLIERRLHGGDGGIALAVRLVSRIAAEPEITSVAGLAAIESLTPRSIQRLFREHVGASPKWVIRWNRLQEVALRIERGEAPSLADLAADLGYTDQAHLARDFRSAVGRSPRAFAASVR